jgi:hypothetical protein
MSNTELELNTEYPPDDEPEDIQRMAALVQSLQRPQKDGRVLRAQHAKDTGCVKAQFIVEPRLPDEYRRGVFEEPRTYDDVIIRFSNASDLVAKDGTGTARGMAIKIPHVDGERAIVGDGDSSQDFLLVDSPTFVFRAVKDYMTLFAWRHRLKFDVPAILAFFPFHRAQVSAINQARKNIIKGSLLEQYWSMTPFRLGPRAVKFTAKPQEANFRSPPLKGPDDPEDFLFQRLANHLKTNEARFDFMVQFQNDAERMPIEDAMVEWKESESPFHKLATVKIPIQDLASKEMQAFRASCETLSFTPWHSLADHRPLGGLNRLRRVAYEASVQGRLRM